MAACLHVGIGELNATKSEGVSIKTMALGSCVAIVMLDPKVKAIGMVHVALPESSIDRLKAMQQPGYFADTAIPALIMKMASLGCNARGEGMIIKLMGGSNIMDTSGVFNIGKRNILSCRKLMWQLKLPIQAEDLGGEISRTVEVFQSNGKVFLSCPKIGKWEI